MLWSLHPICSNFSRSVGTSRMTRRIFPSNLRLAAPSGLRTVQKTYPWPRLNTCQRSCTCARALTLCPAKFPTTGKIRCRSVWMSLVLTDLVQPLIFDNINSLNMCSRSIGRGIFHHALCFRSRPRLSPAANSAFRSTLLVPLRGALPSSNCLLPKSQKASSA